MIIIFKKNTETLTKSGTISQSSVTGNIIYSGSLRQKWIYYTVQHGLWNGWDGQETDSRLSI